MNRPQRWLMQGEGYGRSPRVCADLASRWWAAWIAWTPNGEVVRLSHCAADGRWSDSFACGPARPQVTGLALAPLGEGVVVAWTDCGEPSATGLQIATATPAGPTPPRRIAADERRPAHPALAGGADRFLVACSMRGLRGRQVVARVGRSPDDTGNEIPLSLAVGMHIKPAAALAGDRFAVLWQTMERRRTAILARLISGDGPAGEAIELAVAEGFATAEPAVSASPDGGCWAAWQSDLDSSRGAGLTRWIEVRHLAPDGAVRSPEATMTGVDRRGRGEDQGFEAPALACLADGRLVVVGRGSQSLRRQDLGAGGWSDRAQIDEEGWRCRGRRFDAAAAGSGLLVAGREKDGVAVRWLPPGDKRFAGAPPLGAPRGPASSPASSACSELAHRHIIAGQRVLFGDIHQHTLASDGTGSLEETYQRARDRYCDDMTAVADHESFLGKRTPPGEWAEVLRVADEFYEPGSFVTLPAFEWTGAMHPGPGHKVVYLPAAGGPVLSRDDERTKDPAGLLAECRRLGALAFPHHVGWTGADLKNHDPRVQTCFEIVSCHGAYERAGCGPIGTRGDDKAGQFVADALDAGLRFGLVGGSDGHGLNWHHGLCRVEDSHRTGLTAVFCREVSREAVLDSLRRRLCYATSGAKIGLWFEVDGRPMGEELVIAAPVSFRVVVATTSPLAAVAIVSNGGRETKLKASGNEADIRGTLPPPPEGGWSYHFVRVVQRDGEAAWSSPIWLDAPAPA